MINIGILAYNEENNIEKCVLSVANCLESESGKIFVIVNGSTDNTESIVRRLQEKDDRIFLKVLEVGDKSNAWNDFIHATSDPEADFYVLMDGDVWITPGSLAAMRAAFDAHPEALAVAATPRGGRTAPEWSERVMREHGLPGNFYALRGATVHRIRESGLRFPFGMIGDDTFLLWLLRRNLDPAAAPRKDLIRPVAAAGFHYDSLDASMSGLIAHIRRLSKYALRDVQIKLLLDRIKLEGVKAIPSRISEVYDKVTISTQIYAPYGLRPFNVKKLFFLYTWMKLRSPG